MTTQSNGGRKLTKKGYVAAYSKDRSRILITTGMGEKDHFWVLAPERVSLSTGDIVLLLFDKTTNAWQFLGRLQKVQDRKLPNFRGR